LITNTPKHRTCHELAGAVFYEVNMPALMSLDCEYTHPATCVGELMEIGMKIVPYDFDRMVRIDSDDNPNFIEVDRRFPVYRNINFATDWVKENQAALHRSCSAMSVNSWSYYASKLIEDLSRAKERFGGPIVVCGWDIASDMAYLLYVLAEHHHLIHHAAIDITGMLIGATGKFNPTMEEISKAFDFHGVNREVHSAISDARFQLDLALAVIDKAKKNGTMVP